MAKKFNKEKVLYFASQQGGFEVRHSEPGGSTCRNIVSSCLKEGLLNKTKATSSADYYGITLEGEKQLLKMQIAWRKRNGKDYQSQLSKLSAIEDA